AALSSDGITILQTLVGSTMRLGTGLPVNPASQTFVGGIVGQIQGGVGFDNVNIRLADGRLGHQVSSPRYKEAIKPMTKPTETLFALKPVTFRFKKEVDPQQGLDYGLIAEDVAKISPELAVRNKEGEIENVRYQAINAMLLNEFLKEHKKVEEQRTQIADLNSRVAKQEATIAQQQKGMEVLTAQLKDQAAQIQKVSAQLELGGKPAAQAVANNQ